MVKLKQLSFFEDQPKPLSTSENAPDDLHLTADLGTFKDSLRAPIFRWFQYPAGYSYKLVYALFEQYNIRPQQWVYDPFSGTGTTLICAKQRGINAYGVEAHSFVHWVADVKLYWEYDYKSLTQQTQQFLEKAALYVHLMPQEIKLDSFYPELIYKCYHLDDLRQLHSIKEYILTLDDNPFKELVKLALTDTLRSTAAAGTGWPYIAPNKNTGDKPPKNALKLFQQAVHKMIDDVFLVGRNIPASNICNILGDSRTKQDLEDGSVNLAITSPPYLNNYDYADRTRLETYFWGLTHSWSDITKRYRNKLMVAATTQIVRKQHNVETVLSSEINDIAPVIYQTLQSSILALSKLRLTKGGKKDYDMLVALYFNGMLKVVQESYRLIDKGGHFCLVLGDSAPYGVHIPTEKLIGELGVAIGFKKYEYSEFRTRGNKWKANPQRHTVPLREGLVVLSK